LVLHHLVLGVGRQEVLGEGAVVVGVLLGEVVAAVDGGEAVVGGLGQGGLHAAAQAVLGYVFGEELHAGLGGELGQLVGGGQGEGHAAPGGHLPVAHPVGQVVFVFGHRGRGDVLLEVLQKLAAGLFAFRLLQRHQSGLLRLQGLVVERRVLPVVPHRYVTAAADVREVYFRLGRLGLLRTVLLLLEGGVLHPLQPRQEAALLHLPLLLGLVGYAGLVVVLIFVLRLFLPLSEDALHVGPAVGLLVGRLHRRHVSLLLHLPDRKRVRHPVHATRAVRALAVVVHLLHFRFRRVLVVILVAVQPRPPRAPELVLFAHLAVGLVAVHVVVDVVVPRRGLHRAARRRVGVGVRRRRPPHVHAPNWGPIIQDAVRAGGARVGVALQGGVAPGAGAETVLTVSAAGPDLVRQGVVALGVVLAAVVTTPREAAPAPAAVGALPIGGVPRRTIFAWVGRVEVADASRSPKPARTRLQMSHYKSPNGYLSVGW
jgi:hypothetical protein